MTENKTKKKSEQPSQASKYDKKAKKNYARFIIINKKGKIYIRQTKTWQKITKKKKEKKVPKWTN